MLKTNNIIKIYGLVELNSMIVGYIMNSCRQNTFDLFNYVGELNTRIADKYLIFETLLELEPTILR